MSSNTQYSVLESKSEVKQYILKKFYKLGKTMWIIINDDCTEEEDINNIVKNKNIP